MSERGPALILVPPDEALSPGDLVARSQSARSIAEQERRMRPPRGADARSDIPDRAPTRDRDRPATASPWG